VPLMATTSENSSNQAGGSGVKKSGALDDMLKQRLGQTKIRLTILFFRMSPFFDQ
jgi:hypothetical protein